VKFIVFRRFLPSFSERMMPLIIVPCSIAPDNVDEADDFDDLEDVDNMMKGYLRVIRRGRRIACVTCYDVVVKEERKGRKRMIIDRASLRWLAGWAFTSVPSSVASGVSLIFSKYPFYFEN
jgi:hypothetical protein